MTSPAPSEHEDELFRSLLNCPLEHLATWLETARPQFTLDLLQTVKNYIVSHAVTEPKVADQLTRYALVIAEQMPEIPLASALACWARGFWEIFYAPHDAILHFQQALTGYRRANDPFSIAALSTNLVYVFAICGRFQEAEAAYLEALPIFFNDKADEPYRFMRLEQNYGLLLHNQGCYEEAITKYQQVFELAQQHNYPVIATEMRVNQALALMMQGRLVECETLLLEMHQLATENEQTLTVARIDMNLGELYTALGQPATALRRLQSARERFAEQHNQMEVGSVLMREAALFQRIGAERSAHRSYAQAKATFLAHQMQPEVGQALVQLATLYRTSFEFKRAEQMLDEAESIWTQLKQSFWLTVVTLERIAFCLESEDTGTALALLKRALPTAQNMVLNAQHDLLMAEALRQHGDLASEDQARRAYERVLVYAQAQGDRWIKRQALVGLGQLLLNTDAELGQTLLEEAVYADDRTRQTLSVEELKASFHAHTSELLPILARFSVARQQPRQALAYSWKAKSAAFADLALSILLEQSLATEEASEIQQTRQQLAVRRWTLAKESTTYAAHEPREMTDKTIQALEEHLYALRRKRNYEQAIMNDRLFDNPQQQLANMDADILLEYMRCGDDILGIRATRNGDCHAVWLCTVSEVLDLLDELQLYFQNVVTQPVARHLQHSEGWQAECLPLLRRCYERLIKPFLATPARLSNEEKLLIAPCDPLFSLPFAAFWDGEQYLTERYSIELIPSGGFLALPPPLEHRQTTKPVVIAASAEGALAGTQVEAQAIAATLPESICFIDQPGAITYLNQLSAPPHLLHIAAHNIIRNDAPIFSALQLTKEVLSVEQCYGLTLTGTQLVTLSGCTTIAGMDTGGALLAFQSAFFSAGAARVLSSLWPISDNVTAHWMEHFYRLLASDVPPIEAMRHTQLALIAEPAYSHPGLWAAFICTRR